MLFISIPATDMIMEKDILGRKSVIFNRSKLRDYCTYRNKTYNLKIYGPKKRLYKIFIKYNTYFLFKRKFDIENLRLFNRAFFDGLRSDFPGIMTTFNSLGEHLTLQSFGITEGKYYSQRSQHGHEPVVSHHHVPLRGARADAGRNRRGQLSKLRH